MFRFDPAVGLSGLMLWADTFMGRILWTTPLQSRWDWMFKSMPPAPIQCEVADILQ